MFTLEDTHCVIDLETLSTEPNGYIIQIGAVLWNTKNSAGFSMTVSPIDPSKYFDVSADTLAWWDSQDPAVRSEVFSGKYKLSEVLEAFNGWLTTNTTDPQTVKYWANGPEFDLVILNTALAYYGYAQLPFRNFHSVRTAKEALSENALQAAQATASSWNLRKHIALDDATFESLYVKSFLNKIL